MTYVTTFSIAEHNEAIEVEAKDFLTYGLSLYTYLNIRAYIHVLRKNNTTQ